MKITFIQDLSSDQIGKLTTEQVRSISGCYICGSECDRKAIYECKNILIAKALEEEKEVGKQI